MKLPHSSKKDYNLKKSKIQIRAEKHQRLKPTGKNLGAVKRRNGNYKLFPHFELRREEIVAPRVPFSRMLQLPLWLLWHEVEAVFHLCHGLSYFVHYRVVYSRFAKKNQINTCWKDSKALEAHACVKHTYILNVLQWQEAYTCIHIALPPTL